MQKKVRKTDEDQSGKDSDDDLEQAEISRKFQAFKREMAKYSDEESNSPQKKKAVIMSERRGGGNPVAMEAGWAEPEHRLMVYNSEGLKNSSKVMKHACDNRSELNA